MKKAFQNFKTTFTKAPILIHLNFSNFFYMETNLSNFALRAVLLQMRDDKKFIMLHFIREKFSYIN